MSICDGIANGDKGVQQRNEVEHSGLSVDASPVPRPCRLAESAASDEAHGVERLLVVWPQRQLIDQRDTGMLQLACNTGFLKEARPVSSQCCAFRSQLFQSDVSTQAAVMGKPHASDTPNGV